VLKFKMSSHLFLSLRLIFLRGHIPWIQHYLG
jgi:hypothetical protein